MSLNFTEGMIQTACWVKWQAQCRLLVPNYTAPRWFEADLWRLSKAGLTAEYEIKVSRADFRSDQKKKDKWAYRRNGPQREPNKHARLQLGDEHGPNQFWFIAPTGIIPLEELPEFAGLIELEGDPLWPKMTRTKNAPRLHKNKADHDLTKILNSCYYRYWQLRQKLPRKADLTESQIDELLEKDLQGSQRTRVLEQAVKALHRQNAELQKKIDERA